MERLWKILLVLMVNILLSTKVADGEPTFFRNSRSIFCHLTRICYHGNGQQQRGPGSNPVADSPPPTLPPAFPAATLSPSQVPGSITRRAELLMSIANMADFINAQIERHPVLEVLRYDLAIEHSLNLRTLAVGKLAGEDEHELFRILTVLAEVLPVIKNFRPRVTPGPLDVIEPSDPAVSSTTPPATDKPPQTIVPPRTNPPPRPDSGPPQYNGEEDSD